jgi:hypothetical protein
MNTGSSRTSTLLRLRRALAATLLLPAAAAAQWSSTPYQSSQPVTQTNRLIVHENALGIQAFSPSAARWTTVSPPRTTTSYACCASASADAGRDTDAIATSPNTATSDLSIDRTP